MNSTIVESATLATIVYDMTVAFWKNPKILTPFESAGWQGAEAR